MKSPVHITRQTDRSARVLAPKLLSVNQVCDQLGIGRTNFYALVAARKLAVVKLGRRTLIRTEALDSFIESLDAVRPRAGAV